ncbi:MAG: DUF429 domain-containing protein [Betaproteobacteria bacterium]|nr:MAG: DUF429 domain-containing protein [Betaproteobacteria bacterium]
MLQSTFRHLRGISAQRELELWRQGVLTWEDLAVRVRPQFPLFNEAVNATGSSSMLGLSRQALRSGDIAFFAKHLDRQEHYRIALTYPKETIFLDIETTGLSRYYDYITLVGWSIDEDYGVYVRGDSNTQLHSALAQAKAIVTFNGSIFDIPFLRKEFHNLRVPEAHVDLRFLGKRVGLSGGQKAIEEQLGLKRRSEVKAVTGEAAPILWHRYRRGDLDALKLLIEYNHADIEGMKFIFDYAMTRLFEKQSIPSAVAVPTQFAAMKSQVKWADRSDSPSGIWLSPYPETSKPLVTIDDLIFTNREPRLCVVGIDLSGSEGKASGWCWLHGNQVVTKPLKTDDELIRETMACHPHVVSIDSPLSLPKGRTRVEDDDPGRSEFGIMRFCERLLKKRGVNVYPALIPSMQKLTARGIRLATAFRSRGIPVIESYPGAAQDIMNIPRKRAGMEFLEQGLAEFGVAGNYLVEPVTHDELDAITSAIVGVFFWCGRFERLGEEPYSDEALIIPDLNANPVQWQTRFVVGISGAVAAGKTTAAKCFENLGYCYGRYSQVVERVAAERHKPVTRAILQEVGNQIHEKHSQRWLGKTLLQQLPATGNLVVDGIRFPEDHALLVEAFGPAFFHLHIGASYKVRRDRYKARENMAAKFEVADFHPVEKHADELAGMANLVIDNEDTLDRFNSRVEQLVKDSGRR